MNHIFLHSTYTFLIFAANYVCSSPKYIRWAEPVARTTSINYYQILAGKPEGKTAHRRPKRTRMIILKLGLKTLDFLDWIHITQGRIQQRAHVKILMRFLTPERLSLFSVSYSIKLVIFIYKIIPYFEGRSEYSMPLNCTTQSTLSPRFKYNAISLLLKWRFAYWYLIWNVYLSYRRDMVHTSRRLTSNCCIVKRFEWILMFCISYPCFTKHIMFKTERGVNRNLPYGKFSLVPETCLHLT